MRRSFQKIPYVTPKETFVSLLIGANGAEVLVKIFQAAMKGGLR
jgi:hypothetical protein